MKLKSSRFASGGSSPDRPLSLKESGKNYCSFHPNLHFLLYLVHIFPILLDSNFKLYRPQFKKTRVYEIKQSGFDDKNDRIIVEYSIHLFVQKKQEINYQKIQKISVIVECHEEKIQ